MTDLLSDRIAARLARRGLVVSESSLWSLSAYLQHLARWNRRVNLTAIPLCPSVSAAAIDKLLVEPVVATSLLACAPRTWFDLGSGGGSPAIPLRIVWRAGRLTMVESREKKGAFLRDAVRELQLASTIVETCRFEDLATSGSVDLITLRAVRIDAPLVSLFDSLLAPGGQILAFGGSIDSPLFPRVASADLPDGSLLSLFRRA
ncbi:MAG: RsmG family class I SAM-dependent methyltransferase [Vicinamibacterales bacterium]